jgi:hypothetical protein
LQEVEMRVPLHRHFAARGECESGNGINLSADLSQKALHWDLSLTAFAFTKRLVFCGFTHADALTNRIPCGTKESVIALITQLAFRLARITSEMPLQFVQNPI